MIPEVRKNPRLIVVYEADQTVQRNITWKHNELGEIYLGNV